VNIEQSELREKITRTIRLAMANELTSGTFSERQANREIVADNCADAMMESLTAALANGAAQRPLERRSEEDRLRYVLQKIADFPYIGEKAAQQMQLMAKGALAVTSTERGAA